MIPHTYLLSRYGIEGTPIVDGILGRGYVSPFCPRQEGSDQTVEKVDKVWRWSEDIVVEKFLGVIVRDELFEYHGEKGERNLAAILAAYESVERGRSIKIRYN